MKKYIDSGKKDTRSGFGAGLTQLGKTNPNVVALCADLIGSLKMDDFKENHPESFFQIPHTLYCPICPGDGYHNQWN